MWVGESFKRLIFLFLLTCAESIEASSKKERQRALEFITFHSYGTQKAANHQNPQGKPLSHSLPTAN
jgi:hypothetical protein